MGTNQDWWSNSDGSTTFYNDTEGEVLSDFSECEGYDVRRRDGIHGLRLFFESRGYTVTANYNQYIQGWNGNANGFTLSQYQEQIDQGYPVIIHVQGHSMLGVGYETNSQTIYVHDTWDYETHAMTWGGAYSDLAHYGVSVITLAAPPMVSVYGYALTNNEVGVSGVVISTNDGYSVTSDANGFYDLSLPKWWSGVITPEYGNHMITPESITITSLEQDYSCDFCVQGVEDGPSGAAISVSSPTASNGGVCTIDIDTSTLLESWGVVAYQFQIDFNPGITNFQGYDVNGTLSANGMVETHCAGGNLTVGFIQANPLSGSGTLLHLRFIGLAEGTSPITISNFLYNTLPVPGVNSGTVTVTPGEALSQAQIGVTANDLNIGEMVDVTITTSELSQLWGVTAYQFQFAFNPGILEYVDRVVDGTISNGGQVAVNAANGMVTIGFIRTTPLAGSGALLKLRFRAIGTGITNLIPSNFLYNTTSVPNITMGSLTVLSDGPGTSSISIGSFVLPQGQLGAIPISTSLLSFGWGITDYHFRLYYNSSIVSYHHYITAGTLSLNGTVTCLVYPGYLDVSYSSNSVLTGQGTLLTLSFEAVGAGSCDLILDDFQYDDIAVPNLIPGAVTVTPNHAPSLIQNLPDVTISEDSLATPFNVNDYFTDSDDDELYYFTDSDNMMGISIDPDGLVHLYPSGDWSGNASVTIMANDGVLSVADNFVVTVTPVNDSPVIVSFSPASPDVNVGSSNPTVLFSVHASDVDSDLTYTWTQDGNLLAVVANACPVTFQGSGDHTVQVDVSDGSFHVPVVWNVLYTGTDDKLRAALLKHMAIAPNPFNPETTISFCLPAAGDVKLEVFNIRGERVAVLIDSRMTDGIHNIHWNGRTDNGDNAASGVYFFRLRTPERVQMIRGSLLK
jgi:hypothetical protein